MEFDEHSVPGGQSSVQEGRDYGIVRNVLLAFLPKIIIDNFIILATPSHLESLSKTPDDVFVILQQGLEDGVVLDHVLVGQDLREVVEDVKGPDIELVHGEDGGVAANDEGKTPKAGNPVSHTDGQLSVEILGAPKQLGSILNADYVDILKLTNTSSF